MSWQPDIMVNVSSILTMSTNIITMITEKWIKEKELEK